MSFFAPVSTPVLAEGYTPVLRRAFDQARRVGNYALVQVAVQLLAFTSGILLVRWLPQREYGYFTIANAMQATLIMLADMGIGVGLISIGGRVWHDRNRFGELINTGMAVRRKLAVISILIVGPILYAMLVRNGASQSYALLLIAIVLIGFAVQLSIDVYNVVPRLRSDIAKIQTIDFISATARLILVVSLVYLFTTAGLAVAIATASFFLQYVLLRSYVHRVVNLNTNQSPDDRREIFRMIKTLAASTLFYCFQGQISVFLISFFGHHVGSVAEVGALGRLAMIFTVLFNMLTNVFVPAFARCQDKKRLLGFYLLIAGGVSVFSLAVLGATAFFPDAFLFVLGKGYTHLHRELLLLVGTAVVSALASTLWMLNASKAWISGSWLYIPLTLATQLSLIPFIDFSTVAGVLTFSLISLVPSLALNLALSIRGFRSFAPLAVG